MTPAAYLRARRVGSKVLSSWCARRVSQVRNAFASIAAILSPLGAAMAFPGSDRAPRLRGPQPARPGGPDSQ